MVRPTIRRVAVAPAPRPSHARHRSPRSAGRQSPSARTSIRSATSLVVGRDDESGTTRDDRVGAPASFERRSRGRFPVGSSTSTSRGRSPTRAPTRLAATGRPRSPRELVGHLPRSNRSRQVVAAPGRRLIVSFEEQRERHVLGHRECCEGSDPGTPTGERSWPSESRPRARARTTPDVGGRCRPSGAAASTCHCRSGRRPRSVYPSAPERCSLDRDNRPTSDAVETRRTSCATTTRSSIDDALPSSMRPRGGCRNARSLWVTTHRRRLHGRVMRAAPGPTSWVRSSSPVGSSARTTTGSFASDSQTGASSFASESVKGRASSPLQTEACEMRR